MNLTVVLTSLSDGDWHSFDELSAHTNIEKETLLRILGMFREYGFVAVNTSDETAKLDESYIKL